MVRLRFWCHSLSVVLVVLLLLACDGGGGGSGSGTTRSITTPPDASLTTLNGQVADGYLRGARVFLDRNGNRVYDSGEPMDMSENGGAFSLSINPGEGAVYSVVVEVLAGETVDEDTGVVVADSYLLESPPGQWSFVSPLTTLVNLELNKNPTMTLQKAELNIKNKLGVADEVSLFEDYLAPKDGQMQEYTRTHKAAQAVAALMGTLRKDLRANLGGEIADEQQHLAAYLISDQILMYAIDIEEALNKERNDGITANVVELISNIEDKLDSSRLDEESLDFYAQRVEQQLEFWDMNPPRVEQQVPLSGAIVSIDTVISIFFDKELDPTTLGTGVISLRGPLGTLVPGALEYNMELKRLRFVPSQMLLPYADYEVTLSGALADTLGNRLRTDVSWHFSTIFDQTPPPLLDLESM